MRYFRGIERRYSGNPVSQLGTSLGQAQRASACGGCNAFKMCRPEATRLPPHIHSATFHPLLSPVVYSKKRMYVQRVCFS